MSGLRVAGELLCTDCRRPATWRVSTMSGWVEFCDEHARWYLDKSPEIYPVDRIGFGDPP